MLAVAGILADDLLGLPGNWRAHALSICTAT